MGSGKEVLNYSTSTVENVTLAVTEFLQWLEKILEEHRENKNAKVLAEHIANGKDIDFRFVNPMCYEEVRNALLNPMKYFSPEILKREFGENYKDKLIGGPSSAIPFMIFNEHSTNQLVVVTREEDRALVEELLKDVTLRNLSHVSENKLVEMNKGGKMLEVPSLSSDEYKAFSTTAKMVGLNYSEKRNDDKTTFTVKFSASSPEEIAKANICLDRTILNSTGFSAPEYADFHSREIMQEIITRAKTGENFMITSATNPSLYVKVDKNGFTYSKLGKDKLIKRSDNMFEKRLYLKMQEMCVPVMCSKEEYDNWNSKAMLHRAIQSQNVSLTEEQERMATLEVYAKTLYEFKSSFNSFKLDENIKKLQDGEITFSECFAFDEEFKDVKELIPLCKNAEACAYILDNEITKEQKGEVAEYITTINEKIEHLKSSTLVYEIDHNIEIEKTLPEILREMDKVNVTEVTNETIRETANLNKESTITEKSVSRTKKDGELE